jgi:hypothetical protein
LRVLGMELHSCSFSKFHRYQRQNLNYVRCEERAWEVLEELKRRQPDTHTRRRTRTLTHTLMTQRYTLSTRNRQPRGTEQAEQSRNWLMQQTLQDSSYTHTSRTPPLHTHKQKQKRKRWDKLYNYRHAHDSL